MLIKDGKTIAQKEIVENAQRLCRVHFEQTLCDSVKVVCKATRGCKEIRVFEVRIK